jgi:catechol 2,3-dioxygenase-like lactoylglutathione lyase family enzyme
MDGGGGFEIWQYTSRNTEKANFKIQLGDYGLYSCKIKSRDIHKSFEHMKTNGADLVSDVQESPSGLKHFFVKDPNGNIFNIVESNDFFSNTNHPSNCGGVYGSVIGVSDIDKSLKVYQDILGYDKVLSDKTGVFKDLKGLKSGETQFRRVLLTHSKDRKGPFSKLLGSSQIELIQSLERTDCQKIFKDRYWGDWGFIHLCFDIQGMDSLMKECASKGFPFTVDSSNSFDMGEAAGRFSYIEDPDGTLIEFVETHKVPIMKKFGWYLNLKNRKPEKDLPKWMIKTMGLNKIKD